MGLHIALPNILLWEAAVDEEQIGDLLSALLINIDFRSIELFDFRGSGVCDKVELLRFSPFS